MKRLPTLTLIAAVVLVSLCSAALSQGTDDVDAANKAEARRIWELAVQAKGGRERLQKIKSYQLYFFRHEPKVTSRETPFQAILSVLPDKYWSFVDYGKSSVFGTLASMTNFENGTTYFAQNGRAYAARPLTALEQRDRADWLVSAPYFLELPSYRVDVQKVESKSLSGVKVFLITASIGGDRVELDIDASTYFPRRVVTLHKSDSGNLSVITYDFSQYKDVEGVTLPTWVTITDSSVMVRGTPHIETAYIEPRLNVAYDSEIFHSSPAKLTYDAWRSKD